MKRWEPIKVFVEPEKKLLHRGFGLLVRYIFSMSWHGEKLSNSSYTISMDGKFQVKFQLITALDFICLLLQERTEFDCFVNDDEYTLISFAFPGPIKLWMS